MAVATKTPKKKRTFHQELVLNRWMLSLFNVTSLNALKDRLGEDRHEGIDEDGQTRFFHEITRGLFDPNMIEAKDLRRYDLNIVEHWSAITVKRNAKDGAVLTMKYFQYLSLLFTEIYLDWYFNKQQALLDALNATMALYRAEDGAEPFRDYVGDDLGKLAFWNATGSGKTLLLHVNIKQYLYYFQAGRPNHYPDRIILLTPNEGLSRQHIEELALSGMAARAFDKNTGKLFKGVVDVIEITKLGDEMGDKTVATAAFEGHNLVLVDEGHRGAGTAGGQWMSRRAALVKGGFAFEYSATFSQSVAKGATVEKAEADILNAKAKRKYQRSWKQLSQDERNTLPLTSLERERARIEGIREAYAKAVLIDYSYKYFYADGYGKESLILNMDKAGFDTHGDLYFTACLLSFYQQLWLWNRGGDKIAPFGIEKPLWVFVGNTVSGESSDVLEVVRRLALFLNKPDQAIAWIESLQKDEARLLDGKGRDVFQGRFTPLMNAGSVAAIYADILSRLFNVQDRARLKLVNMRSSKGELALRVGSGEAFGLINIGDDAGFFKEAEGGDDFDTETDDFGAGLFGTINAKDSKLNVLIGSRKFTEGWSSWRVSTMGLLNMGAGEGSQIIQLFGRGVRLKGQGMSLKRSLPKERPAGYHLERLETLNIFGVKADYMATFKDYLIEEGITPSDEIIELDFKTTSTLPKNLHLKTLKLKDGYKDNQRKGFKRTHSPWLFDVPAEFIGKMKQIHVVLDLYPKIEAISTAGAGSAVQPDARKTAKLKPSTMALFDWDRVFLAVQSHKITKSFSNLRLTRNRLIAFATGSQDWYTLYAPVLAVAATSVPSILAQQATLIQLLKDYTDRFYAALKAAYEGQFYDIEFVGDDHGSMLPLYQFEIPADDAGREYEKRLNTLKSLIADGALAEAAKHGTGNGLITVCLGAHVFQPLFAIEDGKTNLPFKLRPLGLGAPSEVQFVADLETFAASQTGKAALAGKSLYLLRNADTKAKGLGFATAGNFYPDFLLWLIDDKTGHQWLSLVDPKGILHMSLTDPKLGLYKEIKEIEAKLADPLLTLNAFIVSRTPFKTLINVPDAAAKADLEARNVLFMDDGAESYLGKLVEVVTQ
jgi:Type III restriction enzyme, res subunit